MQFRKLPLRLVRGALLLHLLALPVLAQEPAQQPVTFTTQEDHQHMLKQLGITRLRPGPSGREGASNPANYDESLANPYPNLPEVLTLKSGQKVTTPDAWWKLRDQRLWRISSGKWSDAFRRTCLR
jgi:hypothetical protein